MSSKQKILAFSFIAVLASIIALPFFNCNQHSLPVYHSFLESAEFKKQTRAEQIVKCTSCHRREYENEQKGPHANAFKSLAEHKEYVNSSSYKCDYYTAHVNRSYEACLGCHTPQNMYETLLRDSFDNPFLLAVNLLKEDHPRPLTRSNVVDRSTGIDCMSCHLDEEKIISLKHIFKPEDSIVARQTKRIITVNNINCYLCHFDIVRNFNPSIAIKRTGSALCVNCHQEYDAKGKGTHYYNWQHDEDDKQNHKPALLLDDFHFKVGKDGKTGLIIWRNTVMPHRISPGPEMVLLCDVLDKDSTVLGKKTIYINKKKDFDKEMYTNLGNHNLMGSEGHDVPLNGESIEYEFPLKNSEKAIFFRISFMHKSQYWFPDSLGKVSLVKTYRCK